ncbi:MAG: tRNA (adenosine(37)-N6)-threonylcarbamoyltransferase complex transferase subunit TsaD [Phycisphaeraceae bacterium]|nr:MAG: tRNA (adenosine(37)-N6)-threonylcarbamoyltransferase complex transferase subunit TsaD [Phycisphaeraceae bacterium]
MFTLGIETSCDETAAAVVEDARFVRSSVVASQDDLHAEYGGVVPELAGRAHVEKIIPILRKALRDAGLSWQGLDAVAVGHRPGLIGSLLVGVSAAKAIAWSLGVPLVGVDHVQAHLFAPLLEHERETDEFPALGLVVSGGHTSLYRVEGPTSLARLGGTIDDAVGEVYDKVATILGLPYPGGPRIDALAREPGADDRMVDFPVSRLGRDSLDFSFSGLKTAVLYEVRGKPASTRPGKPQPDPAPPMTEERRRGIAASFQRAAIRAVTLKLGRALDANPECRALLVGGGVSANSRLRADLAGLCARRGVSLRLAEPRYCVDNAAMIAGLGAHLLEAGEVADLSLSPVPTTAC